MVGISFKRPVGPFADTKELEYISALHQSGEELRADGSIQAIDIVNFLSSRHGIEVSEEVVTDWIICELGGTPPAPEPSASKSFFSNLFDEEESSLEFAPLNSMSNRRPFTAGNGVGKEEEKQNNNNPQQQQQEQEKQPVLDLCQLLTLLLIPFFRSGNIETNRFMRDSSAADGGNRRETSGAGSSHDDFHLDYHRQEVLEQAIELALQNILGAIKDTTSNNNNNNNNKHHYNYNSKRGDEGRDGISLTPQLLRQLLEAFGEYNVSTDIVEEMILTAQTEEFKLGGNLMEVFLDNESFLHALTSDTQLYDPQRIDKSQTTHFDDARKAKKRQQKALYGKASGLGRRRTIIRWGEDDDNLAGDIGASDISNSIMKKLQLPFNTIFMASNIDSTADTYRSTPWFILVWVEAVLIYFAYMEGQDGAGSAYDKPCEMIQKSQEEEDQFYETFWERLFSGPEETDDTNFGAAVAGSVVSWALVVLMCMTFGLGWIYVASLGNTTHPTEKCWAKITTSARLLLGMSVVALVTVATFFIELRTPYPDTKNDPFLEEIDIPDWNTCQETHKKPAYWAAFIGGLCIMAFQFLRLLGLFLKLGPLDMGGMELKEKTIKIAASFKVHSMVENALILHVLPPSLESMEASKLSKTFLNTAAALHRSSAASMVIQSNGHDTNGNYNKESKAGTTINKALLNFQQVQGLREVTGGVIWAISQLQAGTLFTQEGIFFHGRLLAVNFVQFFVVALMIGWYFQSLTLFDDLLGEQDDGCTYTLGENIRLKAFDPFWNLTVDGFANLYNINETHFSLFGFDQIEGQFPKHNGSHFNWANTSTTTEICFEMDIEEGLKLLNSIREATGIAYLATSQTELETQNQIIDLLGVKDIGIPFKLNATDIYINQAAAQNEIIAALDLEEWQ